MSRLLIAILFTAAAAFAAEAQTGASTEVIGKAIDIVLPPPVALLYTIQDIGGKTQDLQVKETATEIRIELAADVLFEFDKSDIRAAAADTLKKVGAVIREHPKASVRIEGHTDGKGTDARNQPLSEARAKSVRDWLVAKEGLKGVAFSTQGFGSKHPVAPNTKPNGSDDPDGRQKNRRVEIVINKG
jgi:outer membrane protein OmpA-like peptidoglycan-associated protein